LASNRDVGIQLHGAFGKPGYKAETVAGPIDSKNTFTYQVGVSNGSGDDGSPNNNSPDTDNNKEVVGRLFAHPFQHTGYSWLEGLGLGVAGTFGNPDKQALKNQATPLGRTVYLDYTKTNTVGIAPPTSNGGTSRVYPQAYWYSGPFGAMGEYVVSSQHVVSGTTNVNQKNKAWQILGSYVVTGEDNTFGFIKPIRNFDPLKGNWGALQFAARYSELDVDNDTFRILNPSQSASQARAWAIGANWFLNSNAVIKADYENVSFSGGAGNINRVTDRNNEQVFSTRLQLSF
jgi:phosphate-selective porin OprO/OprP